MGEASLVDQLDDLIHYYYNNSQGKTHLVLAGYLLGALIVHLLEIKAATAATFTAGAGLKAAVNPNNN